MINKHWVITVTIIVFALTCAVLPVYSDNQTQPIAFSAIQNGALMLYNSGSGPLKVKNPAHIAISKAIWSPDGSHIAYLLIDMATHTHVMVADTQTGDSLELKVGQIEGDFPFNFTADGQLIYVAQGVPSAIENGYIVSVYSISLTANAVPQKIGSFSHQLGCGGVGIMPQMVYWDETGFGGNYLTLSMTPFGLLHSTSCGGNRLAILNVKSGKDTRLMDGLSRAMLSPDGTHLLAITRDVNGMLTAEATLQLIDLSTLQINPLTTSTSPDQVTWSNDGTLYYSSRTAHASLLTILTDNEKKHLPINVDAKMLQSFDVQIHHLDPGTGKDQIIYNADAYAIGHMAVGSDSRLYFSQIAHLNEWLKAIGSGTLDLSKDADGTQQAMLVPVSMFSLSADIASAPVLIGTGYNAFALRQTTQITSAPSATALPTPLVQAGNNPGCQIRLEWPVYTIVRGDTLINIARRVNSTAVAIGQANCLAQLSQINVGQTIHVPRLPSDASPTTIISPTPTPLSAITPTVIPATYAAQLISFTTDTPFVKPDGTIKLHWTTINTTGVRIENTTGSFKRIDLPQEGSLDVPVAKLYDHDTEFFLHPNTPSSGGYFVGSQSLGVKITVEPDIVVHALTIDRLVVAPGDTITIAWNITGATSLGIAAFDNPGHGGGLGGVTRDVTFPTGSWKFTIPMHALSPFTFVISPIDANGWYGSQSRTFSVKVTCPYAFLAATYPDNMQAGCPNSAPTTIAAAFQQFEHGIAIWRGDMKAVFVIPDGSDSAIYIADTWHEGDPESAAGTPPPGRYQPIRGFGKAWTLTRDRVGWAMAPEQAYRMSVQSIDTIVTGYWVMTLPNGRIIAVDQTVLKLQNVR